MVRARRAAAAVVAAALAGVAAPAAHATDHPAGPGQDQGTPAYYDSGLAPTPYMGWNTYYGLGAPTEDQVKSVADKLVSSGLKDSGYNIVWLDGGWQADTPRDADGRLAANAERFPSGIPALVSYLHKRGSRPGSTPTPVPTTAARAADSVAGATTPRTRGSSPAGRSTR